MANPAESIGAGIMEIASAAIGITVIALLLKNAKPAGQLLNSTAGAFATTINAATLQGYAPQQTGYS